MIKYFKVEVEIPKEIFQEKDHWDERYYRKRAIYLAYLASAIKPKFEISFQISNGVRIKPFMIISAGKFEARILTVVKGEFCKKTKFAPERNNMHYDWWAQKDGEEYVPPATPGAFENLYFNMRQFFLRTLL